MRGASDGLNFAVVTMRKVDHTRLIFTDSRCSELEKMIGPMCILNTSSAPSLRRGVALTPMRQRAANIAGTGLHVSAPMRWHSSVITSPGHR